MDNIVSLNLKLVKILYDVRSWEESKKMRIVIDLKSENLASRTLATINVIYLLSFRAATTTEETCSDGWLVLLESISIIFANRDASSCSTTAIW